MSAGQFDLEGNETEDPRAEKIAKALWWEDAKRTWGRDGRDEAGESIAKQQAKALWPRMRPHYMASAGIALRAIDS